MVSEPGEAVKPGSFTRLCLIRHLTLSDRNGDKNPTAWKVTLLGVWINSLEADQSAGCSVNTEVVTWLCQGSVEMLAMQTADFRSSITERCFLRIISVWQLVLPSKRNITIQTIHATVSELKQILGQSVSFLLFQHQRHSSEYNLSSACMLKKYIKTSLNILQSFRSGVKRTVHCLQTFLHIFTFVICFLKY